MQLYLVRVPKSERRHKFVSLGNQVIYLPLKDGDASKHEMALTGTLHRTRAIKIEEVHQDSITDWK